MSVVSDNVGLSRFELIEDGHTAFATYRLREGTLIIPHVESPPPLRGKGTAGRLMQGVAATARSRGLKVVPLCSYAALWFRRHPDEQDLIG